MVFGNNIASDISKFSKITRETFVDVQETLMPNMALVTIFLRPNIHQRLSSFDYIFVFLPRKFPGIMPPFFETKNVIAFSVVMVTCYTTISYLLLTEREVCMGESRPRSPVDGKI